MQEVGKFKWIFSIGIIALVIAFNFNFFRPDIWATVSDKEMESGARWDEARFASLPDYWPNFGHKLPDKISDGKYINYFPGWNHQPDKQSLGSSAPKDGLILSEGAIFSDTPVRTLGNWISVVAVGVWIVVFVKFRYVENTRK